MEHDQHNISEESTEQTTLHITFTHSHTNTQSHTDGTNLSSKQKVATLKNL